MNEQSQHRRIAVPWDGDAIVDCYMKSHPSFPYREQFIQLLLESYHSFLAACPRASIIVAGEALLRAINDCIIRELSFGKTITLKRKRKEIVLSPDSSMDTLFNLTDELTFCESIIVVEEMKAVPSATIRTMYVIKELRNRATHGEFPLLDEWNPAQENSDEQAMQMLFSPTNRLLEGYRFIPFKKQSEWYTFDLRNHKCSSFQSLSIEDRFAAIQFLLTFKSISEMSLIKS